MKKRILLADPSKEILRQILQGPGHKLYEFETATSGRDCLEKIKTFAPDLLIADLLLPEIHGIEILKRVKSDKARKIGVILTSAQAMIQNYHAALEAGADYFLEKPFEIDHFYEILSRFFKGSLTPPPFPGKTSPLSEQREEHSLPPLLPHDSYIKFWGTRGSNPVSGQEYLRYGGNTPCLQVSHKNDLVIFDAGTGIRGLGETLPPGKTKNLHLVIGHTHWDHIIGFPFFAPIYDPDCHITIWSPIGFEKPTKKLFTEMLGYAYFPVRLDDIRAKLTFKDIQEGVPFSIGEIEVNSHYAYHPGATLCFKIKTPGKTFGYATDNEMLMGYQGNPAEIDKEHPLLAGYSSLLKFFKGCDLLIHEAQYFPDEYEEKVGWGHSSISNATVLIKQCGIQDWIVTHHDPSHTDQDLQRKLEIHREILEVCKHKCQVRMAFDGLALEL